MEQQLIRKKKKKRNEVLILTTSEQIPTEQIIATLKEIRDRLHRIFKSHIGKENFISPFTLFSQVFNRDPRSFDIYKRNYLWVLIKKTLQDMRRTNELFVVNTGYSLFVLQTDDELKKVKAKIEHHIERLKHTSKNAEIWVREKKWKDI